MYKSTNDLFHLFLQLLNFKRRKQVNEIKSSGKASASDIN